ncbi:MAG: pilus assembly protein TadG-related protein [Oligoflexia bacterium]|nr:pilus assembly protein TadG-related protein [Oligoflexia bacterium]
MKLLGKKPSRPTPAPARDERGQISILLGGMMLTFVFFFAFVVNTGMLVNAKINLQNAADLAAYAGASVQARQLNQIAFLNYEMRRQYKKFLFRYYVMGNMSQQKFPRPDTGGNAVLWSPDGTQKYGLPVVCVTFKKEDNGCKLDKIPGIAKPKFAAFDAITKVLTQHLEQLEKIKEENCTQMASANSLLLSLWLWNTDPDFKHLNTNLYDSQPKIRDILSLMQSLGAGLGLVPRELMLRARINTLTTYLNQPGEKDLDLEKIQNLKTITTPEPPMNERKIQAFLSAYYTLGNHAFPGADVKMDELLPETLMRLKDIRVKFDAYAIDFENGANGECKPLAIQDGVRDPLPVGVSKDPDYLTYYAIRLRAKARLLFSPFGDLELTAYSAAQPFGSRIGPELKDSDFLRPSRPQFDLSGKNAVVFTANAVPNLPIRPNEGAGPGQGWDREDVMRSFFSGFMPPGPSGTMSPTVTGEDIARAYQFAMAPNPYEVGKYTIPTDVEDEEFMKNFDTGRNLAFWAPIAPRSKNSGADSEIQNLLAGFMDAGSPDQQKAREAAKTALTYYLQRLRKGEGEMLDSPSSSPPEGFNIAHLADPTRPRPQNADVPALTLPGGILETDPHKLRTSWADVNSGEVEKAGRVGYSVKFVSFELLQSKQIRSDGRAQHKNPIPTSDGTVEADTQLLWH